MKLYPHQERELEAIKHMNKCALYWDMGLGKTYGGSEKMIQLRARINLVICQKSKIDDWVEHFQKYYQYHDGIFTDIHDLTKWKSKDFKQMLKVNVIDPYDRGDGLRFILVINYELAFKRKDLRNLKDFTLMLDESSMIQNDKAKRSKFILGLNPKNLILLSGTPVSGKYEKLYSQLKLLGWNISKTLFENTYCVKDYKYDRFGRKLLGANGFPVKVIVGYKNVERLKRKLAEYGARFLKTDEVFDLPEQVFNTIHVPITLEYKKFKKPAKDGGCIVTIDDTTLVGDTTLTKMLYQRMLCGSYNKEKLNAFRDLLESTNDRLIVFYNFNQELEKLSEIALDYTDHISIVNGQKRDLSDYEQYDDTITFIQFQAGSMGLNLQKANKIIYFTPPLSSELFEQSKKRTHRIGQSKTCFYYFMTCKGSIESKIYDVLSIRRDYTNALFEKECL